MESDYTYYNQGDSRWGNDLVGKSGKKMSKIGCLVTCIAMIKGVSPKTLNDDLSEDDGYTPGGALIWSKVGLTKTVCSS